MLLPHDVVSYILRCILDRYHIKFSSHRVSDYTNGLFRPRVLDFIELLGGRSETLRLLEVDVLLRFTYVFPSPEDPSYSNRISVCFTEYSSVLLPPILPRHGAPDYVVGGSELEL